MYGKILSLDGRRSSGAIQSEQGDRFNFDIAAVLAYDVAGLNEGQMVSFEPDGGSPPKAINISVLPPASVHYSQDRYREIRRLRYAGFDQHQNIRSFRFERYTPGALTEHFAVDADMAQLSRYHITLQEGPELSLRVLTDALRAEPAAAAHSYMVTGEDMQSFASTRDALSGKPGPRRIRS